VLTTFFFKLKEYKVPVTLTEWLTFIEALAKGLAWSDLDTFYSLSRSLLVKDVAYYDAFDQVFAYVFKGQEISLELQQDIRDWLENPIDFPGIDEEAMKAIEKWGMEKLIEEFEKRMKEQDERHDGGNRWVGTGGTSPFGHGGYNPQGIRVGGEGGGHRAMQVATERRFRNYRKDMVLDTRQLKVALKKLRALERVGVEDELDLEESIDQTCRNAGDLELVFRPEKKNRLKLLLLMDAGGSMDPYARLVNSLFSAASQMSHFKEFKHYYFHNCVYEEVFEDIYMDKRVPTGKLFRELDSNWRVIIVGDASMSPYELTAAGGAIYYYHMNDVPGIEWLKRIKDHFHKTVWLNPTPKRHWYSNTIFMINRIFPMETLSIEGLEEAVRIIR